MHDEKASMMHQGGSMPEIWGMLNEDQKRQVIAMKLEMKLQWMEMKVEEMQKMIEMKKKAIDNLKCVHSMITQGQKGSFGEHSSQQAGSQAEQYTGESGGQQTEGHPAKAAQKVGKQAQKIEQKDQEGTRASGGQQEEQPSKPTEYLKERYDV